MIGWEWNRFISASNVARRLPLRVDCMFTGRPSVIEGGMLTLDAELPLLS